MRSITLFIGVALMAIGAGGSLGARNHPQGPHLLTRVPWAGLSVELQPGLPGEWRFPLRNGAEHAVVLPRIFLVGCSVCVTAQWILPVEPAGGVPQLEPGQVCALCIRYAGASGSAERSFPIEFRHGASIVDRTMLQLSYSPRHPALRDALSFRAQHGTQEQVVIQCSGELSAWFPVNLDSSPSGVAATFISPRGDPAAVDSFSLIIIPHAPWGTQQSGSLLLAADVGGVATGDLLPWSCLGLSPIELMLAPSKMPAEQAVLLRGRLGGECLLHIAFVPTGSEQAESSWDVRTNGTETLRLALAALRLRPVSGEVRVRIGESGVEKCLRIGG